MDAPLVRSLAEAETHIASLYDRTAALEAEAHDRREENDTFVTTAAWKRWLFIADGWSGHQVMQQPRWRPWRRWWTS